MSRLIVGLLLLLPTCSWADSIGPVATVRTAAAEPGAIEAQTVVYGIVEAGPDSEQALVAPAEAIVQHIDATNGTPVVAGQAILTLRPSRAATAERARAAADSLVADAAYARARRLRADGLAADGDVETARAAAATAQAVRANLGPMDMVLQAPVAGTVQGLAVHSGDQVAAGVTLATVEAARDRQAHFGVDPALAARLQPGQALVVAGITQAMHATASIAGIDPRPDPATRLAAVYARLPPGLDFGLGQALRGTIPLGLPAAGVTIPYAALLDDGGRSYVFVVRAGIARAQTVTPGSTAGDRIGILTGLAAGDLVVTEGGTALVDAMRVIEQGRSP